MLGGFGEAQHPVALLGLLSVTERDRKGIVEGRELTLQIGALREDRGRSSAGSHADTLADTTAKRRQRAAAISRKR
jgi:hypothetical protein